MTDTFLQEQWYAAALSNEVTAEAPFARTVCGEDIVFFRSPAGDLRALEDRCAHRYAPLSLGAVEDGRLRCQYHGMLFDHTGQCVEVPGQDTAPEAARIKSYSAAESDGWVWVWIGRGVPRPVSDIPSLPYFDSGEWSGFQKYFHVKGAAQLFVDNLLDLSHLAFTHKESIGSASSKDAAPEMEFTVEGNMVRGRRYIYGVEPGPFIAGWGGFTGLIDRCSDYIWRPPSVMEIESKFMDATKKITVKVINPITPETETTSHFWMGWARDFRLDEDDLTEQAIVENTQVIMEDVEMIEAQQKVITARGELKPIPIQADRALMAVRTILKRLHEENNRQAAE